MKYMKDFNGEKIFSLEYDKETLRDMLLDKQEEIERLNNIINELEKCLIEYSQDLEFRCYANTFLDKLNELKGGSSND